MRGVLDRIGEAVERIAPFTVEGRSRFVLFVSRSDGASRASVFTVAADDARTAWAAAVAQLGDDAQHWLRVDWVIAADRTSWGDLRARLSRTKRNYFRLGISLDAGFERAFLETELNANAALYGGPGIAHAVVNEANFSRYARIRHGLTTIDFADDTAVWTFVTGGVFADAEGDVYPLGAPGRDTGRRRIDRLEPDAIADIVRSGSDYLARQVQPDGRFTYGWHPCFDRPLPGYNCLRHASSLYAMVEAWEVTQSPDLFDAIDRALAYLAGQLIHPVTLPDGQVAAFLVDEGDEIKLGGNAVCLLALVKYSELTGTDRFRPLLDQLGAGILHMQDAATGGFVHVLHYPSLAVKQDFRIIYYDGEAAFGLMRLHALTGDAKWLDAVERAFDHFIAADHWKAHDHWLGYAADELTRLRADARYLRFGLDNVRDHLDFVIDRITTFPTLLELMTAAERMVRRLRGNPANAMLLHDIDLPKFYRALHARAHYLMNGHFWPELAMFYADPRKIVGSFFIRHHAFRVRIDDVEHYLSGLIAYRRYLLECPAEPVERGWAAINVARATGGRWTTPPALDWSADGLCIYAPTQRKGDMIVVRASDNERGVPLSALPSLPHCPAAILTTDLDAVSNKTAPVLHVPDTDEAILALGRYARDRMNGRIIGVTGSAGKTTMVAMLAHTLGHWGATAQTRGNANLPHGIAWNLASIPWDTPYAVLELAIGRMPQSTRLARPHVALFTNILPAHLEFHQDLATIARRKSAIFDAVAPDGFAVLSRDMAEAETVRAAALARGLDVIDYGRSPEAMFRLTGHGAIVRAETPMGPVEYPLASRGEHMALNSLAVLATLHALGLNPIEGIARLSAFEPLPGRGAETRLSVDGRRVVLIDDAYNANPGSMAAALRMLGERKERRRVAVLGEMLELGPDAAAYHDALAPLIEACGIERVYMAGDLYAGLHDALSPDVRGVHADTPEELEAALMTDFANDDVVLFKGSRASGIHRLVTAFVETYRDDGARAGVSKDNHKNRPGLERAEGRTFSGNNVR